jgi:predicted RND superfamily exporter protein
VIWPSLLLARLAGPMARRPGRLAVIAALVCLLGAAGFARWSVDAGADLLVGRSSPAQQVADRFTAQFGADPVVLVFNTSKPAAYYLEQNNLLKLVLLESDVAGRSGVASVLGPGTVVEAAQRAAQNQIQKTVQQYNQYVFDRALLAQVSGAGGDPSKIDAATLQKFETDARQAATLALAELVSDLVKAAGAADSARTAFNSSPAATAPDTRIVDAGERAAQDAAAAVPVPPTFAQYLSGGGSSAQSTQASSDAAHQAFVTIAAAYGDCYQATAQALSHSPTCQSFLARLLYDLPSCPTVGQIAATPKGAIAPFCPPKSQWAAVLPPPRQGQPSYAVISVRLTRAAAADAKAVEALRNCIRADVDSGGLHCSSTKPSAARKQLAQQMGRLQLTECGASPDQQSQVTNCPYLGYTMAGAPLLAGGVADSITHQLEILFPVALLVMLLLLLGARRLRGRLWALPAAVGAALLTFGLTLLTGTPLTPAVLAGVPVLVGLGVDYAVQLLSRFAEERRRGLDLEEALAATLSTSGQATLVAALAMIGGLGVLAVLAGVDLGPLVAVPLVAEFAVVVLVGVAASWLAALLIALPAAAWAERRRPAPARPPAQVAPATRTLALAARWPAVLLPAAALALAGWAALGSTPVQTEVERLLAPSLHELHDLQTVRAQTGYANEVDILLEGQVTSQAALLYQRDASRDLRCRYGSGVAQVTSIADVILGNSATSVQSPAPQPCAAPAAPVPSPSPSPSPAPGVTPSSSPSGALPPGDVVRAAGSAAPAPVSPAPATASPSPAAPSAPPAPATSPQSSVICELRLLAPVSRSLVGGIPIDTPPCPAVDPITFTPLAADTKAGGASAVIDPRSARIVMATRITSASELARLVDQVRSDISRTRPGVLSTAEPTGLTALAVQAYDTLTSRALFLNLVPVAAVALLLLALLRSPRRALLPVLPTALAAGWAPLVVRLLGRLPGDAGATLGSLNPLTVVLGALVVALGTEFGVVLLERFHEERWRGLEPGEAAAVALSGVGRAIGVSALTLGAGFAVLALSGLLPGSIPLIADFGLAVVLELALAVVAVVAVMLPLAVALEMRSPLPAPVPRAPLPAPDLPAPDLRPTPPGRRSLPSRRRRGCPASPAAAAAVPPRSRRLRTRSPASPPSRHAQPAPAPCRTEPAISSTISSVATTASGASAAARALAAGRSYTACTAVVAATRNQASSAKSRKPMAFPAALAGIPAARSTYAWSRRTAPKTVSTGQV